jgi:transcriptional antiterminator NusG
VSEELKNASDSHGQPASAPPPAAAEGPSDESHLAAAVPEQSTDQQVEPGDAAEQRPAPAASVEIDATAGQLEPPAEAVKEPPGVDEEPAPVDEDIHDEDIHDEDIDEEDDEEEDELEDVEPLELNLEEEEPAAEDLEKDWYILKVQSNREASIRDGLARRVQVAGLDRYFGDIIVPTEDVAEFKAGKKKIVKRKMYPGYIVVHMAINDDTWFLVRETPGIGDFTGAGGKPTPMQAHEVDRILKAMKPEEEGGEVVKTAIPFKAGDRVRIKEGTFENFEGEVEGIDEANGRVTVMINIFGRSTPAELEHWQIESL